VFRGGNRDIVLFGTTAAEFGGSEYQKVFSGEVRGLPPALDLARERALQQLLVRAASEGLIESAHDCSDGGLAVALAECTFDSGGIGCAADVPAVDTTAGLGAAATLFSESASRVVASVRKEHGGRLLEIASELRVPARVVGETGGSRLRISVGGELAVDCAVAEAERVWSTALAREYERVATATVA
jgi:phosphoribosylformylglycinamidine synthase